MLFSDLYLRKLIDVVLAVLVGAPAHLRVAAWAVRDFAGLVAELIDEVGIAEVEKGPGRAPVPFHSSRPAAMLPFFRRGHAFARASGPEGD